MPGIHPAVVESMLFLQPSLLPVPRSIWSTQTTLFCKNMSLKPVLLEEKRILRGLLELFVLVFLGGQKSDLIFLGFSWPGLCHCPTGGVSVSRESECGLRQVQEWPVLAGGARIPSSREQL